MVPQPVGGGVISKYPRGHRRRHLGLLSGLRSGGKSHPGWVEEEEEEAAEERERIFQN